MVWKQFELLEGQLDSLIERQRALSLEHAQLGKHFKEKETEIAELKEQLSAMGEERDLIRAKVDEILKKIEGLTL
jgi:septal ring factor EnvC (AmiA/AmiB activator)